jgi:hypothetical protein
MSFLQQAKEALENFDEETVISLLKEGKISPFNKIGSIKNVFTITVDMGFVEIIKAMSIETLSTTEKCCRRATPFDYALKSNNPEIIEQLINMGMKFDPNEYILTAIAQKDSQHVEMCINMKEFDNKRGDLLVYTLKSHLSLKILELLLKAEIQGDSVIVSDLVHQYPRVTQSSIVDLLSRYSHPYIAATIHTVDSLNREELSINTPTPNYIVDNNAIFIGDCNEIITARAVFTKPVPTPIPKTKFAPIASKMECIMCFYKNAVWKPRKCRLTGSSVTINIEIPCLYEDIVEYHILETKSNVYGYEKTETVRVRFSLCDDVKMDNKTTYLVSCLKYSS